MVITLFLIDELISAIRELVHLVAKLGGNKWREHAIY